VRPGQLFFAFALTCLLGAPAAVGAQQACEFLPGTRDISGYTDFDGTVITSISNPRMVCEGGSLRVAADSAVLYDQSQIYQLFGNVDFANPDIDLRADNAQYDAASGRITSQGSVRAVRREDGASISGEDLLYIQAGPQRAEAELTVTGGRPRAEFPPGAAGGAPPDPDDVPWVIDADRIVIQGKDFRAGGRVEIRRGDLEAFGEEVETYGRGEQLVLRRDARLHSEEYDLRGQMILLQMPGNEVREVVSRGQASLEGERMSLRSPVIWFSMIDGTVEQLVAGRGDFATTPEGVDRPTAIGADFNVVGDSLEIAAPGGALTSVLAMGSAHAKTTAGSATNADDTPDVVRSDWIEGDTILALFAPADPVEPPYFTPIDPRDPDAVAADPDAVGVDPDVPVAGPDDASPNATADPNGEYRLESLQARVDARALYRMAPADTTDTAGAEPAPGHFAVHYVTGDEITVYMTDGAVTSMEVVGQTRGLHLEPPAAPLPPAGVNPGGPTPPLGSPDVPGGGTSTAASPERQKR